MLLFQRPSFKQSARPADVSVNLPRGWNFLTTEQLEKISRIMIDAARKGEASGIWSREQLMSDCFLYLAGLEVICGPFDDGKAAPSADISADDDADLTDADLDRMLHRYYVCQFADERRRKQYQTINKSIVPIRIYIFQIYYATFGCDTVNDKGSTVHTDGPLEWLLKACDLTRFPYPEITLADPSAPKSAPVEFHGPSALMDGMTWRQYRISSDFVQYLTKCENKLLAMQRSSAKYGTQRIAEQKRHIDEVRSQFLANLFCRNIVHNDMETGQPIEDYFYTSSQITANAPFFANFPEEKFQAILLWWQGMMRHLSKQYPKVFRTEKTGKNKPEDDPLKVYTTSTTTLMKYSGMSEDEVNRTTYSIILQQMNFMADENDQIKEMRAKRNNK